MPGDLANIVLAPMLACFLHEHLTVQLEVDLSPRRVDLIGENFDLAIRMGNLCAWDTQVSSRCFVHLVNSQAYSSLTGDQPPNKAPTAMDYTRARLPWFEYYDENMATLTGEEKLSGLDSIAALGIKKNASFLQENKSVNPVFVKDLHAHNVWEGKF